MCDNGTKTSISLAKSGKAMAVFEPVEIAHPVTC
jgi:hypothetical protein